MAEGQARVLDGKALGAELRATVADDVLRFRAQYGRAPGLHVVLVGDHPASQIYVRNKEKAASAVGIAGVTHRLPAQTAEADLIGLVERLNEDPSVDGILVQLPLPKGIAEQRVLDRVDPAKDVDGLHPLNAGYLVSGRPGLVPCTPQGCMRLIDAAGVRVEGARAVVVGRSNLVGKPLAQLLLQRHATVTMAHSRTRALQDLCRQAEILVVAAGRPGLVPGDWIGQGAVVIDVGTNRLDDGRVVGDVDFASAQQRASAISPVPGGVGPLTIAYLLSNTVAAAWMRVRAPERR